MLWVAPSHRTSFAALGLNTAAAVARHFFGATQPDKSGVDVNKRLFQIGGVSISVFCKQYVFANPSWQFIGRKSKARCEFANYEVFSRLGISCAEPIVCGEERDFLGRLQRAFIVTREIPSAKTLVEFAASGPHPRSLRDEFIRQIADMTRRIHEAHFFHHDLVWRNILVTQSPAPQLWWIDCPRGQFDTWSPWKARRQLKDLASLDKLASQHCSRRERVQFIKIYLATRKLGQPGKKLIRDALAYRKTRWPEDWSDSRG